MWTLVHILLYQRALTSLDLLPSSSFNHPTPPVIAQSSLIFHSALGPPRVFECLRLHCPVELLQCFMSESCRGLVREMHRPAQGAPEACLRGPEDWCGSGCSKELHAYFSCQRASPCEEPRQVRPIVVDQALTEAEMLQLEALAERQRVEATERRRFGDVRQNAAGHTVTFLTPGLLVEPPFENVRAKFRALMVDAASRLLDAGRDDGVAAGDGLSIRTAEHLSYASPSSSDEGRPGRGDGLGWHHDSGSELTMLAMLQPCTKGGGRLQSFVNCSMSTVQLRRGDVAFYDSRMVHRVTEVRSLRRTLAVEWWRGSATLAPTRPTTPNTVPWPLQSAHTTKLRDEMRVPRWTRLAWTSHLVHAFTTARIPSS